MGYKLQWLVFSGDLRVQGCNFTRGRVRGGTSGTHKSEVVIAKVVFQGVLTLKHTKIRNLLPIESRLCASPSQASPDMTSCCAAVLVLFEELLVIEDKVLVLVEELDVVITRIA